MIAFVAFLALIGAGFDYFVLGGGQGYIPIGTTAAVLIGSVSAWGMLHAGDRAILASSHAEPLAERAAAAATDEEKLRYQQFQNVVEEVAIAAGLPVPKAFVIPDDDPNAFATGRNPEHASIAVTDGLLRTLNRDELQAVVAHEMSHIRNFDIRLLMIITALVGAVVLLADWSARSMQFGRRRSSRDSGAAGIVVLVLWILSIIVAPLVARLLALSVSRSREYLADSSGAELTRNPQALADALTKISDASEPTRAINRGSAALCIADPLGRAVNEKEGRWANLWATHPPIGKRIDALKAMAYQKA